MLNIRNRLREKQEREHLQKQKDEVLIRMEEMIKEYETAGYRPEFLSSIWKQKKEQIVTAISMEELNLILTPSLPVFYDGGFVETNKFTTKEEELLLWFEAAEKVPLNQWEKERYFSLAEQIKQNLGAAV